MILPTSGRIAIATAIMARPLHFAWGSGLPAWDTTPVVESVGNTALVNEIGRRKPTVASYVVPDALGLITCPVFNGTGTDIVKFSVSSTPTSNIYLKFEFDYTDAPTSVIREVGLFSSSTEVSGLPLGQMYFSPAQIATQGLLLGIENLATKITRTASSRQVFEFVFEA